MCDHLAGSVVPGVPDACIVGNLLNVDEIALSTPGSDGLIEDVATGAAIGVGGETRVGGQIASPDDVARQALPFPVVGGTQHHRLTVAGDECAVRRHRW